MSKLKATKPDWPWREDMNLDSLNSEPPLSETIEPESITGQLLLNQIRAQLLEV